MSEKEKRRRQRKQKKASRRHSAPPPKTLPEMPSRFAMEQMMGGLFGGFRLSKRDRAQDLAYKAMDADSREQAIELAHRAVKLNPACADARMLLIEASGAMGDERISQVADAVRAADEDLGPKFFKENRGVFWGVIETRPYMRARAELARLLAEAGRTDAAIDHYRELLDLNPNDNQGNRYPLLGNLLELDRLDEARQLFGQYDGEASAMFAWARVLERHLRGDEPGALEALEAARESNRFAEAYLSGRKALPTNLPEYYSLGDESEAIVCATEIGRAWCRHPQARKWLAARAAGTPSPRPRRRRN